MVTVLFCCLLAAAPPDVAPPYVAPPPSPLITGLDAQTSGADWTARALDFVASHGQLLGGMQTSELTDPRVTETGRVAVVSFGQRVAGLTVEDRRIAVTMDRRGNVRRVMSDWTPIVLPDGPDIGADAAFSVARRHFKGAPAGLPVRVIWAPNAATATVAYRVPVAVIPLVSHYFVWVSARDGRVLHQRLAGRELLEVVP